MRNTVHEPEPLERIREQLRIYTLGETRAFQRGRTQGVIDGLIAGAGLGFAGACFIVWFAS